MKYSIQQKIIHKKDITFPYTIINGKSIFMMPQNHTDIVFDQKHEEKPPSQFDGMIISKKGCYGIFTADCLPIVIDFPNGIALIHAGWKGVLNNIIKQSIKKIEKNFDIQRKDIHIHIGPHICSKCYNCTPQAEGGDGREILFEKEFGSHAIQKKDDKLFIDLVYCLKEQCGDIKNISIDTRCTFEDTSLPSYFHDKTHKRIITYVDIKDI